ncbi:hypothetical protein [Nocardioides ultimimeridianus]
MHAHRRILAAWAVVIAGLLIPSAATAATPSYTWSRRPSPIVLQPPASNMYFQPAMFCWTAPSDDPNTSSMVCGDGYPPADADLRTARTRGALRMWFGMPGWRFTATLTRLGTAHARPFTLRAAAVADQRFRLSAPRPGRYRVTLQGRGPQGDELIWFRWRVL